MTTALMRGIEMQKRKPGQPHKGWKSSAAKVHDRRTSDLLINAQVAPAVVDDPYSDIGEKLTVMRSTRDDPLAAMLSRKEIDQAQYEAGRLFEKYSEQAEIGNIRAIDPMKEAVDGGRIVEPISDRQIGAVRHLGEAARVLGVVGEAIIRDILIRRYSFRIVGVRMKMTSDREINRLRHRFIECLETLAGFWGYRT